MKSSPDKLIGPLEIESLANGGSGIARVDGQVVFIPGSFPGDSVVCRVIKEKKRYAEAEVVELIQPSPVRRIPPCPVADECGGCQWQQLPYSEQLQWKQKLFSDTLIRQACVEAGAILPIVPSPGEFGYRSRVQIKCFQSKNGFVAGFFRPKSRHVVNVEKCPLMPDALNELMRLMRDNISGSRFAPNVPQFDLSIGFDGKCRVVVHCLGTDIKPLCDALVPLADTENFDLAVQAGRKSSLRLARGDGELQIAVDDPQIDLSYAAGGFAQINLEQNKRLVDAVVSSANLQGKESVLDLYCGMGNFSLPLAKRAEKVKGVEDFKPSIEMAKRNAAQNGINNCYFEAISAEKAIKDNSISYDLLVLDPPRSGAYDVVKQLLERPVAKVIYISCDPQTLARDLKPLLHSGYRMISCQAFDMFPQTFHIESVSCLERPSRMT